MVVEERDHAHARDQVDCRIDLGRVVRLVGAAAGHPLRFVQGQADEVGSPRFRVRDVVLGGRGGAAGAFETDPVHAAEDDLAAVAVEHFVAGHMQGARHGRRATRRPHERRVVDVVPFAARHVEEREVEDGVCRVRGGDAYGREEPLPGR